MNDIIRTPPWNCVDCGKLMDCMADPDDKNAKPTPGDFSFCIDCGAVYMVKDDFTGRKPTDEDLDKLPVEELKHLAKIKAMILMFNAVKRGAKND